MTDAPPTSSTPAAPVRKTPVQHLDAWMAAHPWHPRFAPLLYYVFFNALIAAAGSWNPSTYAILYPLQILSTATLIFRYRRLTPELNFRFHWIAIPVGLLSTVVWIALGMKMAQLWPTRFDPQPPTKSMIETMGPTVGWLAASMRLLGMSIVVPMVEEMPLRSALLRSLHLARDTGYFILQVLGDLPVIGNLVMATDISLRADIVKQPMAAAFERYPLGTLSLFSVIASSLLWCVMSHGMRDWPATIILGIAWALAVAMTNRGNRKLGLGPVIWTHGLCNASLWAWTIHSGDWRFL